MNLSLPAHHTINSDTEILDGLRIMQDSKLSYLLLKNGEDVVTGIFTKTDLLDLIVSGSVEALQRPFHQLMTKPLKTLSLKLMHTAPEFMQHHKINHLPITDVNSETGVEEIVGVVTTRSIFDFAVGLRGLPPIFGGPSIKKPKKIIGVLSPDGMSFQLLDKVFSKSQYVAAQRYRFANFNFQAVAEEVDALVVDIDGIEKRVWLPIVEAAAQNPNLESVCLVFDDKKHEKLVEKLEPLEALGFFKLYEKPIDVTLMISDLEKQWAKSQ